MVLECVWGRESGQLWLGRGVDVRSVASLEMAAGLPGPSGPEGGAQDFARSCGMDRLRRPNRFTPKRFTHKRFTLDRSDVRRGAMPSETAVSTQKQTEIVFESADSSCYPLLSLGAEGIVPSLSHSPK